MTKSQIFFWLLVAFIAGVAAASFLPVGIAWVWAIFILGGIIAVVALLKLETRREIAVVGLTVIVFAFGMLWFWRSSQPLRSGLESRVGELVLLEGIIDDEPRRGPRTQRFPIRVKTAGARILIVVRPYPEFRYGDRLELTGRLEHPENFSGDFDYVAYLAKDDIFYTMRFPEIERAGSGGGSRLYRLLFSLKAAFAQKLNRLLPEPHAAFMAGLTIGERQSFPPWLIEALRRSGTSHLVALSGYNITIVADALMAGLMFLFLPWRWAFWLAVTGIVGFTLLTGAAASVVRSAIMGILVLIARRESRLYSMRNALALAAAAMLLVNPKVLRFDVGFQLSFLATLGLIYGAPIIERWYERAKLRLTPPLRDAGLIRDRRDTRALRSRKRPLLKETLVTTLSAQFAVLPLLVYQFGTLSPISPLSNLAVIPLIPATMFFGFLTGLSGFISETLAPIAAAPAWTLLGYELWAIHFFSALPLASFEVSGFGAAFLIGGYALMGYLAWKSHNANTRILRK